MTNILNLPLISVTYEIANNEPLIEAFGFVDGSNNPISGAGIALEFMVRSTNLPADNRVWIAAVSTTGLISTSVLNGVPVNGTIDWGGVGGNLIVPSIPVSTTKLMPPGTYVGEILGVADGFQRRLCLITLIIDEGIVR